MPSNIENANISAIKLGTADVTKGYIGHEEVYPNTREIQTAVWTDTSNLAKQGGTRVWRVTGEVGAAYNLTGYGAGSYVLPSSPYNHSISVGGNGSSPCYNSSTRSITTTLTPTGSTIITGGAANISGSFTQLAGTGVQSYTPVATSGPSIVALNNLKTTVGGTTYWASGATFRLTMTVPVDSRVYSYRLILSNIYGTASVVGGGFSPIIYGSNGGSVTVDYEVSSPNNISYVRPYISVSDNDCYNGSNINGSNFYP